MSIQISMEEAPLAVHFRKFIKHSRKESFFELHEV
jgi:hypothetical protein